MQDTARENSHAVSSFGPACRQAGCGLLTADYICINPMEKIHYTTCPICGSEKISACLTARDHTVSGESFVIMECAECSGRFTQDVPSPSAIGKYYQSSSYISHTDTREGIVNKLYHQVRKITLNKKKKLVQELTGLEKGSLLDIGAGTGLFAQTMSRAGWEVKGLEPDEGARKVAASMQVKLDDLTELFSLNPGSFDAITLWHVLEHVHELHRYLNQCKRLLSNSGRLIVAVPNYTSEDAKHYGSFWAAYDVPRHLYHFSPSSMKILLEQQGFLLEKLYPQWFDSFYVSLLSEKYMWGKTHLIKGSWEGLRSNMKASKKKDECSSLVYVAKGSDFSSGHH
jgi:SAM-dependent methyltransferase